MLNDHKFSLKENDLTIKIMETKIDGMVGGSEWIFVI